MVADASRQPTSTTQPVDTDTRTRPPYLAVVLLALVTVYPVFVGNPEIFDQSAHRDFARTLLVDGQLVTPHFGYHLLLLGVNSVIPGGALRIAGITVNIAAYVIAATLFFGVAHRYLQRDIPNAAYRLALALIPLTILAGPPLAAISYHTDFRLNGYIIYNLFHSPTQSVLLPLAIALYVLTVRLLFTGELARWQMAALFTLSLVTPIAKPNFTMVLLPGVMLAAAYMLLIRRQSIPWRALLLLVILPGTLALSWQFIFTYIQQATIGYGINESNSIIFVPFKTALYFDTSLPMVALKLVTSLAFPIWALAAYRDVRDNPVILLTWLLVLIGLAQYILVTESGEFYMAGNFNWGLRISALFLYALTLLHVLRVEWPVIGRHLSSPRLLVSAVLVVAHLIGGVHLYIGYANAIIPTLP